MLRMSFNLQKRQTFLASLGAVFLKVLIVLSLDPGNLFSK